MNKNDIIKNFSSIFDDTFFSESGKKPYFSKKYIIEKLFNFDLAEIRCIERKEKISKIFDGERYKDDIN